MPRPSVETPVRLSPRGRPDGTGDVASAGNAQNAKSTDAPDCTSFPCGRVGTIRQVTVKQPWTPLGRRRVGEPGEYNGRVTTAFQIGPGLSNQGIVILGAGGGADYQKRPNSYDQPRWEVTIKLDNGQKRVVTVAYEPFVREGERVRVAGTALELVE
jgi:outer membrane lipoprotein SlyB